MKNLKWFIFALSLIAGTAEASDRIGNGGDALVCPGKVEMLDSYQARAELGLTLNENRPGMDYLGIVNLLLDRLNAVNPSRAHLYRDWLASFEEETERLRGITLIDIPDTGAQAIPAGCHIEQIAVQRKEKMPGQKRYTINGDLWAVMNEFNRAALVLHELVYRERLGQKEWQHSIYVRYFNAHIISENLPRLDYLRIVMFAKLESLDLDGKEVNISATEEEGYYAWGVDARPREQKFSTHFLKTPAFRGRECIYVSFYLSKKASELTNPAYGVESIGGCTGDPVRVAIRTGGEQTIVKFYPYAGYQSTPMPRGDQADPNVTRKFWGQFMGDFSFAGQSCSAIWGRFLAWTDTVTGKNWIACGRYPETHLPETWKLEVDDFTLLPN